MKKLITLLLIASLVLCMPCFATKASDALSVEIVSPFQGSSIGNTSFDVELATTGDISETVIELDGERLTDSTLTESMLTIGEHTVTAFVIGEDGSVESATSDFTVKKEICKEAVSNDLTSLDYSAENFSKSTVSLGDNITIIPQVSKKWKGEVSVAKGPDGDEDIAVGIKSPSSFSSSRPFLRVLSPYQISSTMVFEFDMKVNPGTNVLFSYEGSNDTTGYLVTNTGFLFDKSGKILGTSEGYTSNQWYSVSISINTVTDIANVYVSHWDADLSKTVTRHILDDVTVPDAGKIEDLRINYHGNANCGFAVDNIRVYEEAIFTGAGNIGFIYGDEESFDEYPDTSKLSAIKVYMNEMIVASDLSDKVSLKNSDGDDIALSSVAISDDKTSFTIIPQASLKPNTKYDILISVAANYQGTLSDTDVARVSFKTGADSYAITDTELKVGSTRLLTASQLKGKKLAARVEFSNNEESAKDLCAVLTVRSDHKLVAMKIVNLTVSAQPSYTLFLETDTITNDISDAKIQIMFLNNLTSRNPVFQTFEALY